MLSKVIATQDGYDFWMGVAVSLREQRLETMSRQTGIIMHPSFQPSSRSTADGPSIDEQSSARAIEKAFDNLIGRCLQLATSKWSVPASGDTLSIQPLQFVLETKGYSNFGQKTSKGEHAYD